VGLFFRQFALTIAISTVISTINSLTLSPALAALLLRPKHGRQDLLTRALNFLLGWLFRLFNRLMGASVNGYVATTSRLLRVPVLVLIVYVGLSASHIPVFILFPPASFPLRTKVI
jgi:multidrug efflux pump subunit AcrB